MYQAGYVELWRTWAGLAAWPGGAQFKKTAGAKFDVIPQIPVREPTYTPINPNPKLQTHTKRLFFCGSIQKSYMDWCFIPPGASFRWRNEAPTRAFIPLASGFTTRLVVRVLVFARGTKTGSIRDTPRKMEYKQI